MNAIRALAAIVFLSLACVSIASGQENKPANAAVNPAVAPPYLLVLVHQEIQYGKESARQKLEVATARACNRIEVPNSWIALQSLTGPREALSFDPFDSFEQMEQAVAGWSKVYAAHPDLARMHEEIDALLASEDTIIAVRRDDLGYRVDHIDLSETHFMRVVEVRLLPGHESDFVEASQILGDAYEKIRADTPWVVYQVKMGMQSQGFLVFMPMPALKENDDLLSGEEDLLKAEGDEAAQRLQQIAREAYVSTTSNLYTVSAEMSHVSKEFAAGDPGFWTPKAVLAVNHEGAKGSVVPDAGQDSTKPRASETSTRTRDQ
jgi:hypothetical protein